MVSPSQRVVEPMFKDPDPSVFPLASAVSPGTLFSCRGDVIVCLTWQCVYRGVGAIVCWWRLEIHNRVPGECHS